MDGITAGASAPVAIFSEARSSVSIEPLTFTFARFDADFFFPRVFAADGVADGSADLPCAISCATDGGSGISSAHDALAPIKRANVSATDAACMLLDIR